MTEYEIYENQLQYIVAMLILVAQTNWASYDIN